MIFAAVNLLGVIAFIIGYALARRGKRWAIASAGVALALLVLKCVLNWEPVWEAALFPWTWYIYLQGYWIFALGSLFFGLALLQLPLRWNRVVIALVALAVLARGGEATWWMVSPEHHGDARTADARHHLEQSTLYTCAPSACVCALSHLGISATEREMAELCLTRAFGTTVFNTYRGLTLKLAGTPYYARMITTTAEDLAHTGCIAVIDFPEQAHALSTCGTGTGVILHDPMHPDPELWEINQLRDNLGGVAIALVPRR